MGDNAEHGEEEWEAIYQAEQDLDPYHGVYQAGEEFLGENGVFFDEFGEVVQS